MGDYSMLEVHCALLRHNRTFLQRNIFPSDEFWGLLLEKELLTSGMLEDIQSCPKTSTRISTLLDILPRRGPDAFDRFIEVLLESSQSHVAEKLKEEEARDQFQSGLKIHCQSEHSLQMFMLTFQQTMRKLEHFREQKFEVILDEQGTALEKLEEDCSGAQQKAELLHDSLHQCSTITASIAATVSPNYLSPLAVFDLQAELDTFSDWLQCKDASNSLMRGIQGNLQVIVSHLTGCVNRFSGQKMESSSQTEETELGGRLTESVKKLQSLRQNIEHLAESVAACDSIPSSLMETELEAIAGSVGELIQDVHQTEHNLRRMQHETLSQLYSCKEIARLHQEQGQLQESLVEQTNHLRQLKQKTQNHPRQQQQLKQDIEHKEELLTRTRQDLQCRLKSAGRYRRLLYDLLPNCEDEDEDDEDTRWQTREKGTQTHTPPHVQPNTKNQTKPSMRQAALGTPQEKDRPILPKAKPQKSTVTNKDKTLANATFYMADTQRHERQDSDIVETPRTNRGTTAEKARCIPHHDSMGKAAKRQSESKSRLPSTDRSDSDIQHRTQHSISILYKQSLPSTESDHSNITTARTIQGTSELKLKDDVAGTKYKPTVLPESKKMTPVKAKPKVKQKFKLRSSVTKLEIDNKETVCEEEVPEMHRRSLTINNLEVFGGLFNRLSEDKRRHFNTDTLGCTKESSEFSLSGKKL